MSEPTDLEFPQLWENYSQLLQSRQRMLQSAMAYYVTCDDSIKALYEAEDKSGIPSLDYLPVTQTGKSALERYTAVCNSYIKIKNRFKDTFDL